MIVYRCTNVCPHFAEPCEFEELSLCKTICPIGEPDDYIVCSETEKEFFCLIVGSRSFNDYILFSYVCDKMLINNKGKKIFIVSSGAEGTDKMAERYAKERGYHLIIMLADWDTEGNKAGFNRNKRMHQYIASKEHRGVLAFWDEKSKGTKHSFSLCKEFSNPLKIFSTKNNCFIKLV